MIQRTSDTGTSIDSDPITCYKQRMTITHMTLAELANLVDGDELFMDLVKEGVITLADDNEKIVITDLTA